MTPSYLDLSWEDVSTHVAALYRRWEGRRTSEGPLSRKLEGVYGVPRGGTPVATMVAERLGLPVFDLRSWPTPGLTEEELLETAPAVLVVDDIEDSGRTLAYWGEWFPTDALVRKSRSLGLSAGPVVEGWVRFPWEPIHEAGPEDAVVRLLQFIGEDPNREGLRETPARVLRAWKDLTSGYSIDPSTLLEKTFDVKASELVLLRGIEFVSTCEHHLLPFTGVADVAYVPGRKVFGLSKLARLVDAYARRLQVQERLARQVATELMNAGALGAACIVQAKHACLGHRGASKPRAEMVASSILGVLRSDPAARSELLALRQGVLP